MSHPQQMNFVRSLKDKFPENFSSCKVLEIGSLDINGTIRVFFDKCEYVGADVGPGKCVDIVCAGQELSFEDKSFDTVASCECFEHNPYWIDTFKNMYRMTKSKGLIFMSCATTGRAEHGTSRTTPYDSPLTVNKGWNYYRNLTEQDFINEFDLQNMFETYEFSTDNTNHDLYFVGIKKFK